MTDSNHTPAGLDRGPTRPSGSLTTRRPRDAGEAAVSGPSRQRRTSRARTALWGRRSRRAAGPGLDCAGSAPAPSGAQSCGGPAPASALRRPLTQWDASGGGGRGSHSGPRAGTPGGGRSSQRLGPEGKPLSPSAHSNCERAPAGGARGWGAAGEGAEVPPPAVKGGDVTPAASL